VLESLVATVAAGFKFVIDLTAVTDSVDGRDDELKVSVCGAESSVVLLWTGIKLAIKKNNVINKKRPIAPFFDTKSMTLAILSHFKLKKKSLLI
tara:strand:- start:627 stop:908 length:282 start_codon:yes stop_codon:yes gene_type:complete